MAAESLAMAWHSHSSEMRCCDASKPCIFLHAFGQIPGTCPGVSDGTWEVTFATRMTSALL